MVGNTHAEKGSNRHGIWENMRKFFVSGHDSFFFAFCELSEGN
jgi:hypothetical protein